MCSINTHTHTCRAFATHSQAAQSVQLRQNLCSLTSIPAACHVTASLLTHCSVAAAYFLIGSRCDPLYFLFIFPSLYCCIEKSELGSSVSASSGEDIQFQFRLRRMGLLRFLFCFLFFFIKSVRSTNLSN